MRYNKLGNLFDFVATELYQCFANLAVHASIKDSPLNGCKETCFREQIEEAITIYQEIKWSITNPSEMTNSFFPALYCFGSRDKNHPATSDIIDCGIKNDPNFRLELKYMFQCR
jgi:hypothetical protein